MQIAAVFGIVFAIIVLIFILIFGAGQIINIMCLGNIGTTNTAVKNLEAVVEDVASSGQGSTDIFDVNIPDNARICIINPYDPSASVTGGWMPDRDMLIGEEIQDRGYTLWIEYNCGKTGDGYKIPSIITDTNYCVEGGEKLLLTNMGIKVKAEKFIV